MGYYKGKDFFELKEKFRKAIGDSMELSEDGITLIDEWAFNEDGDIVFIHKKDCGCSVDVGKVDMGLKGAPVLNEEEFILQIEDILLEVDDEEGNSNFLFYIDNYNKLYRECSECKK